MIGLVAGIILTVFLFAYLWKIMEWIRLLEKKGLL